MSNPSIKSLPARINAGSARIVPGKGRIRIIDIRAKSAYIWDLKTDDRSVFAKLQQHISAGNALNPEAWTCTKLKKKGQCWVEA